MYKNDMLILAYLPNFRDNNYPDRRYLMNIINTIYEDDVHKLIKKAIEIRAPLNLKSKIEKEKKVHI